MKRKIILVLFIVSISLISKAQQDPLFTQYMTNPVTINPSLAGASDQNNISMVLREQWTGIDGAPTTTAITYNGDHKETNVGLAAIFINDQIGPVNQTSAYLSYAYHLNFENNKRFSMGLMGGANYYILDLITLNANEKDDDIPIDGLIKKFLPNFGIGFFYQTPKFFAGASAPKLLRNSLSEASDQLSVEDKEERHYFFMTGGIININQSLDFIPSSTLRVVNGSPVSLDLNATFRYNNKIWLGGMYRLGSSVGALIRWQINEKLQLGYSYDTFNSRLRNFNNGSHEILISYSFGKEKGKIMSPGYF